MPGEARDEDSDEEKDGPDVVQHGRGVWRRLIGRQTLPTSAPPSGMGICQNSGRRYRRRFPPLLMSLEATLTSAAAAGKILESTCTGIQ